MGRACRKPPTVPAIAMAIAIAPQQAVSLVTDFHSFISKGDCMGSPGSLSTPRSRPRPSPPPFPPGTGQRPAQAGTWQPSAAARVAEGALGITTWVPTLQGGGRGRSLEPREAHAIRAV